MKAKAEKILNTASYLLANLIKDGKRDHMSNDELTDIALDMTMKLIEKIPDDPDEDDIMPTDEECTNTVKEAFKIMNDRPSTRTQLVNAIQFKCKVKKTVAEYMVMQAENIEVIKAKPRGNVTYFKLA